METEPVTEYSAANLLPPETCLQIFETFIDHERWSPSRYKANISALWSISLVCKTWRSLAEPLLYRKIKLHYLSGADDHPDRYGLVIRNLRQDPDRKNYIENLWLRSYMRAGEERDVEIVNDLKGIVKLKHLLLDLSQEFDCKGPYCSLIIAQIGTMQVESLELSSTYQDMILSQIVRTEMFSNLKCFRICHINDSQLAYSRVLPTHLHYTFQLEVIHFGQYCTIEAVNEILKWPAALKELNIEPPQLHTIDGLQPALNAQSRSLEKISLSSYGAYESTTDHIPDLAQFSSLTQLGLRSQNLDQTSPEMAARFLSCKRLSSLRVDTIRQWYGDMQQWIEFYDDKHAKWWRTFAVEYRRHNPVGRLKRIDILFDKSFKSEGGILDMLEILPQLRATKQEMAQMEIELNLAYPPECDKQPSARSQRPRHPAFRSLARTHLNQE